MQPDCRDRERGFAARQRLDLLLGRKLLPGPLAEVVAPPDVLLPGRKVPGELQPDNRRLT